MSDARAEIAARARACIGVRFRPQGREPAYGLDCVGLIAVAGGVARETVPARYTMRGGTRAEIVATMERAGLRATAAVGVGDVMLAEAGPRQFHLLLMVPGGFVHADAGIGRVVEVAGAAPWLLHGAWTFGGE